jgi:hypothetical protein
MDTWFGWSLVETYELGFDESLSLGTGQTEFRFRQKLVEAFALIFLRNSNCKRFPLVFLFDDALTETQIDGLTPSESEKISLHCPWPFQDGSLSGPLECRAS